jgi:hypothetical protein
MSDNSISIVPKQSSYPEPKQKADEILGWLVSRDIVKFQASDCVLGAETGHAISEGAESVLKESEYAPFDMHWSGLAITIGRTVFDAGANGLDELICPNCKENIAKEDWDMFNEWFEEKSDNITCPRCNHGSEIHQFKMDFQWGFSNLGFTFWNWPEFTQEFLCEFKEKLGCDVDVVFQHI